MTRSASIDSEAPSGGSDYWSQTRQPLPCLIFLAPLLVFYELGVLCCSEPDAMRNGADHWMRFGLAWTGALSPALLPLLVVAALVAWQIAGKFSWRISPQIFAGMVAESLLFACGLVLVGQFQDVAFRQCRIDPLTTCSAAAAGEPLRLCVSFVGAGIYEEVLFRLCLFPLCAGVLRILQMPRSTAALVAIAVTSLLFSTAHYVGPAADTFSLFTFTFRATAGLFFAALFVLRGFGITAGCHATYDVLVGVLLRAAAV